MNFIRQRVRNGDILAGTFLTLGSPLIAELAGQAGFDWVLLDLEHGAGDHEALVHQLQGLSGTPAAPIVRIAWNEAPRFKRVLDAGAAGVMVPYVNTADEARRAVVAMRYPPQGMRGVARSARATQFGLAAQEYFARANQELLTVLQIETEEAVRNAAAIAAVDGADVLFVGPVDLATNLGIPVQLDHPRLRDACARVVAACRQHGKAAGLLVSTPDQVAPAVADGFSFIAVGSEAGLLAREFQKLTAAFDGHRKRS